MTDKENEADAEEKAKRSGLNNSILGGFARTSAKRFAEYKYTAKENEARNTGVATAAPSNRHNRREWLERLFDLFEQYAVEVNKLVDESHLITTCLRPTDKPSDNPLISPSQGVVSTKYWQLTVRLQSDGIAGYLLPMSMEKTFLRDETLFERIFLIESLGDENAAVWSFDNKPTEFFQLPDLAKRFFGSLIEIAQMEDISNFDNTAPNADETATPAGEATGPQAGMPKEDSALFDDEAMFKDLLNFGSTTVVPNAVSDGASADVNVASSSPFASLSAEPVIDLAKLDEQAESVRKKNKSASSDLATKTLDSYALLDFEDADTYYNEYRLTPTPESAGGVASAQAPQVPAPPPPPAVRSETDSLNMPVKPTTPSSPIASASKQNLPAQPADGAAPAPVAAAPAPTIEAETEMQLAAQLEAQPEVQQVDNAEAAVMAEHTEASEHAHLHEHAEHAGAVTWETGTPVSWQHNDDDDVASASAEPSQGEAEALLVEAVNAESAPGSKPASSQTPTPIISAVPQLSAAELNFNTDAVAPSPPAPEVIAPPVITPVTRPSASVLSSESSKPAAAPKSETAPPEVHSQLDMHAYRSNDLDLLTPADVDISATTIDEVTDDSAIAEALLAVTHPSQVPEIKESLSRRELSSEVQKLAAKLQETASDLIGSFNRKAVELTDSQEHAAFNADAPVKIIPITVAAQPSAAQPPVTVPEPAVVEQQETTPEPQAIPEQAVVEQPAALKEPEQNAFADAVAEPVIEAPEANHELRSEDEVDFDEFEQAMQSSFAEPVSESPVPQPSPSEPAAKADVRPDNRTPSGQWKVFSADENNETASLMDELNSSLDALRPATDYATDSLAAARAAELAELAELAEADEEQLMTTETAETEEVAAPPVAEQQIYEAEAAAVTSAPEADSEMVDAQQESLPEQAVAEVQSESVVESEPVAAMSDDVDVAAVESQVLTKSQSEPVAEHEAVAEVQSEPVAEHEAAAEVPSEQVAEHEAAAEVQSEPIAEHEAAAEVQGDTPAEHEPVATDSEVASKASSDVDLSADGGSDSEKQAFSDKFRRSNQLQSKKFQPYSSTVLGTAPAAAASSELQSETESPPAPSEARTFFESLQSSSARRSQSQAIISDNTAEQSQENSMPKTDEMSVIAAIEMMRHSVDCELINVAENGARAFQDQDMDAVEKAMKRTRRVQEFKDQLLPALAAWEKLGREE